VTIEQTDFVGGPASPCTPTGRKSGYNKYKENPVSHERLQVLKQNSTCVDAGHHYRPFLMYITAFNEMQHCDSRRLEVSLRSNISGLV